MKRHRIALIGTGKSVGNHMNAIKANQERIDLLAAVDIDEDRVRHVCEEHHIPQYYTSTADMLAEIQPEIVHIITPPATHVDLAIECMEAGAWVYCEKPLCASLADFDRLEAAERRTGRYVSTVFQWRFGSAVKHLRRIIQNGDMGSLLVSVCHTLWYRTHEYYAAPWRGKWETETGGPTTTLGIHLMDLYLYLVGEWQEVYAMIGTLDRNIEVEDVSMALVRFENGTMGSIINSALSPRQHSYMRLDFQRGTVEMNGLYRASNSNWSFSLPDNSPDTAELEKWKTIENDFPGSHDTQVAELLDSIEGGERPLVSGLESRRILEFTASLYKSAFTRQPVERGTLTPDDPFYHSMNGSPHFLEHA